MSPLEATGATVFTPTDKTLTELFEDNFKPVDGSVDIQHLWMPEEGITIYHDAHNQEDDMKISPITANCQQDTQLHQNPLHESPAKQGTREGRNRWKSSGRYSVFPSGELHIRHVTQADGALAYRCETSHLLTGELRLSAAAGRLLVTSPQSSVPPRITDSRSHVQARYRQPVELPCAAQGFPLPTYTWYRSAEGRSQPVFQGGGGRVRQVGGSLYVTGALLQDSGRYVCVVNNSVGVERASTSLLVTTPLSAYVVPQLQTVDAGRSAQLNCSTAGHPQLAVSWLKDGRPLRASSRVVLLSPQTLLIERVEMSDRGMYQCVVSNNEEAAQGTAEVRLGDSSPALLSAFGGATLQPGAAWSAECEAAGSPLPSVSWLLDGQPLRSSAEPGQRRVESIFD
ncbi:Down syndrome cell adhesion molecule-like protein Dscam2 [Schistocerca cancellata]|uniref:Down syndrome cell adhesion molecule-like protein Dscam2 n=1 Tax=Schistocerca cancellata TaxID=274614 RepID=UPI002117AEBC|nr:Down syndrome cell adhesion molecule-like protein Dscam2 [Schistocerca cancellata]